MTLTTLYKCTKCRWQGGNPSHTTLEGGWVCPDCCRRYTPVCKESPPRKLEDPEGDGYTVEKIDPSEFRRSTIYFRLHAALKDLEVGEAVRVNLDDTSYTNLSLFRNAGYRHAEKHDRHYAANRTHDGHLMFKRNR